jgi:hypothetical protein
MSVGSIQEVKQPAEQRKVRSGKVKGTERKSNQSPAACELVGKL